MNDGRNIALFLFRMTRIGYTRDTYRLLKTTKERAMADTTTRDYELGRRIRSLKILRNLSEFLKILDVNEGDILKSMLVKFAIEAIEADRGALLVFDPVHRQLRYHVCYIYRDHRCDDADYAAGLNEIRFELSGSMAGFALREREVIVCGSTTNDPRYNPAADALLPIRAESAIYLPISVGNEPVAVLEIANGPDNRKLDEADAETLIIITNLASAAMENAQLFLWAISDPLTRLYNIHYYRRTLSSELRRAERFRSHFSVVMIDLDNFKRINDTWGHPMGDQVLVEFAAILGRNLRKDVDIPSRYGGDEFILLLPNTNETGAAVVVNRILKVVRETRLVTEAGEEFGFAISVGISTFPAHGTTEDRLIENADRALYTAKEGGKNCLAVYTP